MTLTDAQKWFFGGVVASLLAYFVTGNIDFSGLIFIVAAIAASWAGFMN